MNRTRRTQWTAELERIGATTVSVEARDGNDWHTVARASLTAGERFLRRCANPNGWRLRDPAGGWVWLRTEGGIVAKRKCDPDDSPGVLFELLHRAKKGARWRRIATAGSRAELVDKIKGDGGFYIRETKAETVRTEGPTDGID